MIYNYPYFGIPSYSRHNSNGIYISNSSPKINIPLAQNINYSPLNHINKSSNIIKKDLYKKDPCLKNNIKSENKSNSLFNLFGIELYFDDILLICLIFFLYNEKTDDSYLLLALVLLLLG